MSDIPAPPPNYYDSVYDSDARKPAMLEELIELVRYRDLLGQLIANHIKTRYRRSALGVVWTLLNPLLTMTVMTIAFSNLFHTSLLNYPVYILAGLLFWNFFSQSVMSAMHSMVWGSGLLKRIYVPRTIFAVSAIGISLVNLGLGIIPLALIMIIMRHPVTPALLFLPFAILIIAMFVLGVALLISSLAVFFTDIVDMFQVILMAWMYLTPIIYPSTVLPATYQQYLYLNPAYNLLSLFRDPIYLGQMPELGTIVAAVVSGFVTLGIGWWFFTRKADEFAYRV
jgi:ABC-type polysaccharide/polyol phosphate export permease